MKRKCVDNRWGKNYIMKEAKGKWDEERREDRKERLVGGERKGRRLREKRQGRRNSNETGNVSLKGEKEERRLIGESIGQGREGDKETSNKGRWDEGREECKRKVCRKGIGRRRDVLEGVALFSLCIILQAKVKLLTLGSETCRLHSEN